MFCGKVEICGVNTSHLKVLTGNETKELLIKAKNGDVAAREELTCGNLKLVLSVMRRFYSRGENPDDLFQVGCIGLMKAIDNFDISQNVRFSTYAVPMIIGEIRRFLRDNSTLRVSRSVKDLAYRILKAKEELCIELSRDPTGAELAKRLGVGESEISLALEAVSEPVSLHEPIYTEGRDTVSLEDQIRDPSASDDLLVEQIALSDAIKKLGDRERRILSMRYFDGKTQMEVASMIDISQAQVSRLEKAALDKIKKML